MQVLEKVSKAILDDFNIKVIFRGSKAYTDGKRIVLPACPEGITESEMDVFRGYCDHEIAHVLFTDFTTQERPELRYAVNAMEDIRVEAKLREKFIGSSSNITKTILKIFGDVGEKLSEVTPFGAITIEGRRIIHNIEELPKLDIVYDKFGADIIDRIVACPNTAAVIALAEELYEKSKEKPQEPEANENPAKPEENKTGEKNKEKITEQNSEDGSFEDEEPNFGEVEEVEGDSEKTEEGGEDSGSEESEDEGGEDSGSEESEDEGGEDSGSDSSEEGEGDGEGSGSGEDGLTEPELSEEEPSENPEQTEGGVGAGSGEGCESLSEKDFEEGSTPDIMEAAKNLIEGLSTDLLNSNTYMPFSTQYDRVVKAEMGDMYVYERMYDEIKAVKGALVKEFESKTKAVWDGEKKSGKVNARRLASLQAGNTAVFRQRRIAKAKRTAVSLLVDCSGSMNDGHKNHQAFKVATLLAETCNLAGVDFEILGFTTKYEGRLNAELKEEERSGGKISKYGRWTDALATIEFKTFKERFGSESKKRIAGYEKIHYANNADAESVSLAAQRLAEQNADRKILIVISDGQPAVRGNYRINKKALKENVKKIEKAGIEVVGIGILSNAVEEYYTRSMYTKDMKEFQKTFIEEIRNILKVSDKK